MIIEGRYMEDGKNSDETITGSTECTEDHTVCHMNQNDKTKNVVKLEWYQFTTYFALTPLTEPETSVCISKLEENADR